MTTLPRPSHRLKSPTCGGFRGPTPPQPHAHASATRVKVPPALGGFRGASPAPATCTRSRPGEEEEELNQKNEPTFHT